MSDDKPKAGRIFLNRWQERRIAREIVREVCDDLGVSRRRLAKMLQDDRDAVIAAIQDNAELVCASHAADGEFGPQIDWEAILAFIEKLLPLILKIINLFA